MARGFTKALRRARRLVYLEDQYMWSPHIARVLAAALRRSPRLHLVVVVPRHSDVDGRWALPPNQVGRLQAMRVCRTAAPDRVHVFDLENHAGNPVYVHAKVAVMDDTWACVGSANLNRRSWSHDSELSAAVLDAERDGREPADPGGHGDGARRFARDLRLALVREHLDRVPGGEDDDLLDPDGSCGRPRRRPRTWTRGTPAGGAGPGHRDGCAPTARNGWGSAPGPGRCPPTASSTTRTGARGGTGCAMSGEPMPRPTGLSAVIASSTRDSVPARGRRLTRAT